MFKNSFASVSTCSFTLVSLTQMNATPFLTAAEMASLQAALVVLQGLPASSYPPECSILLQLVPGLILQSSALRNENELLRGNLAEARKVLVQQESSLEAMQQKVEEGVRKEWQLEKFRRMLFGKRSERYMAYHSELATQPALGAILDAQDMEAVIRASRERMAARQTLADHQTTQSRTNRHQKRHCARKGKRLRSENLEKIVTVWTMPATKPG